MKTTIESIMNSYNESRNELTMKNRNIDFTNLENVYQLVGQFKTMESYKNRIKLFVERDGGMTLEERELDMISKAVSKPIERAAIEVALLCEREYQKTHEAPFTEDKKSEVAPAPVVPAQEVEKTKESNIKIQELFNNAIYIKASGFRGAMTKAYGKLDDIYNATETNIPASMKPMINHLLELTAFSAAKGFETIVTGYENNDETNTFIYFLSRCVDMYNANTNKKKLRLIVLRGKECNVNLKENIDYCVTGNFNSSPVVIQKHGVHVRKITELLNDARQARTFKVYNGEIFLDGARVPVMPYLRELNYRNCGLSEQGFKRAFKYCVPLVSGNNAAKLEKRTLKYDHKTTLQMIKDFNISTCIYIGNHVDSYKEILKKNTKITSYKGYTWDVILNDIPAQEAAAYSDQEIVSDGLPLGK